MDDDLMFSMEEEGSARRPSSSSSSSQHSSSVKQRASSLSDANASDDEDDEDNFISPVLGNSVKDVCNYLKELVYSRQLSNSLPKSNFSSRVSAIIIIVIIVIYWCSLFAQCLRIRFNVFALQGS